MNCAAEPAQRNSELKQLIPTETKKIRQAETGFNGSSYRCCDSLLHSP